MLTIPIGAQGVLGQEEVGLAVGNEVNDPRRDNRPDHLGDDVWDQIRGGKPSPDVQTNGDRGVQVTAGNMTNGIGHGQHGKTEGQGYSVEPDTKVGGGCDTGEGYGKSCTTTATEDEPEGTNEFGDEPLSEWHTTLLCERHEYVWSDSYLMAKHTYTSPPCAEEDRRRLYTKRHVLCCGILSRHGGPPRLSVALPAIPPYNPIMAT